MSRRLYGLSVVAAVVPVVVAAVRAVERGWLPVGDNGYFALRARDVLTEHHPLLGTWTSASVGTGTNFNNPGPLLFDLLALPAKLVDSGAGLVVGAALLNVASIVAIAVVARRRGGDHVGTAAMVVTALLCWSMGSELLFDPWQPHSLLLPFLLTLVLVWSVAAGDLAALPVAAGVASLVVQTHLSYGVLIAGLAAWALAGLVLHLRRARDGERDRGVGRILAVTAVVVALCWAQPVVEQLTGDGEGNLSRLAGNVGQATDETIGYGVGTRLVASVVAAPPWWVRPSFAESLLPADDPGAPADAVRLPDLPSGPATAGLLAVVGLVLLACALVGRLRREPALVAAAVTGAVAVGAGLATAGNLPLTGLGISPHQFRWLWPMGAFLALVVVITVVRGRTVVATGVLAAVTVAVAAANLPAYNAESGPSSDAEVIPVVARLHQEMDDLEDGGAVLVDLRGVRFAEPFSGALFAELQRHGIEFVVDDAVDRRQVGESRAYDGENADRFLMIREGDATRTPPPGTRLVALVEGLDEAGQRRLEAAQRAVAELIDGEGVPLNERGEAAVAAGRLPFLRQGADAEVLLAWREVDLLVTDDLVDLDARDRAVYERYADLQRRWDRQTVGLFVGPVEDRPPQDDDGSS